MTKKITVLGKNLTAANAVAFFQRFDGHEVEWRFENNPIVYNFTFDSKEVYPRFLYDFLNFRSPDLEYLKCGVKFGNHKKGWGQAGTEFLVDYPPGMHGYCFDDTRLINLIETVTLASGVTQVEGIPTNTEDLDTDHIMDCRDLPDNMNDYTIFDKITTNRILIKKYVETGQQYFHVKNHARQYGWAYVVPTIDQVIVGYVFNSNLNTDQDIENEFTQLETELGINSPTYSTFVNFSNYYKNDIHSARLCYNHHMAFNCDPLDTSAHTLHRIILESAKGVWDGNFAADKSNVTYTNRIKEHFHTLCLHYMVGSVYDTPFWTNAKQKALEGHEELKTFTTKYRYLLERVVNDMRTHVNTYTYGAWHPYYFHINLRGLGLEHLLIPRPQF